jgi:prostaglandin reductase 3
VSLPSQRQKLVAVRNHDVLREAVEVQTVPLTPPDARSIVVKTAYVGVNAADYMMAAGRYLVPTPPPFDLGAEAVGHVVAVGSDVTNVKEGDAVLVIAGGGYQDYFTIAARHAVPIPTADPGMISLGISGLTAAIALERVGEMKSGETVLVTAAAGGTGMLAVQWAKQAGNTVIGTCSSDDKVDFLRSIGCDRPINYKKEKLSTVLKEEFSKGVDIVFEGVGGSLFDTCVNALAVRGRLICIGSISEYETGPQPVTAPRIMYKLMTKSASIRGFWLMHFLREFPTYLPQLMERVQQGKLLVHTDETVFESFEGALQAIDYMYAGKNTGKVVVRFN